MKTKQTDAVVRREVLAELKWEPSIDAALIGVQVKFGRVFLSGRIDSYASKCTAVRAAQGIDGVKSVSESVDVVLTGSNMRSDDAIALAAKNVFQSTTSVANDSINIGVENGWLTLSGQVELECQRQSAERRVRYLTGITGISDHISISPKEFEGIVKADIEAALARVGTESTQSIFVDVRGSGVTLSGSVGSWAERDLARQTVWGSRGVRNVVDNIKSK